MCLFPCQPCGGIKHMLPALILGIHLAIILFNVIGLVIIPIGAWRGWRFVHAPVWRLLHIASWMIVALQVVLGRACFLTDWQSLLEGGSDTAEARRLYCW